MTLRCSIGLGPNRLLAKMAGEIQKPDGLMVLDCSVLPEALYGFELSDIPGVGRRMEKRLHAAGIATMRQLCALPRERMRSLWGSVLGDRFWLWLRGENFLEPLAKPLQTLSRQHILPPECRNAERARGVALKLLHTTARRLRQHRLWAGGVVLQAGFVGRSDALEAHMRIEATQSTVVLQACLVELWKEVPSTWKPSDLTVGLVDLTGEPAQGLFESLPDARDRVHGTLDELNSRFGLNSVYLGSIHEVRKEAPTRITFGVPPALQEFEDVASPERPD
jgi:DNA polymerase-4